MPEIPILVSQQSYGSGVASGGAIPLAAGGSPAGALSDGFDRVSAQFAHLAEAAHNRQAATDAMTIGTDGAVKLTDLRLSFANDPEPSTMPKRYLEAQAKMQAELLARTNDPKTRELVQRSFTQHAVAGYANIAQDSIVRMNNIQSADFTKNLSTQAQQLAGSANAGDAE